MADPARMSASHPVSRVRRVARADLALALALVAWMGLSAYRAHVVSIGLDGYLQCDGCLRRPVLAQDAWLLLALPLAFLAARWLRSRVVACVLALATAALAAAFVADVFVQR